MTTTLYLRAAASDLAGTGQFQASLWRGAASTTAVTNTAASGTNIGVTKTAAGTALTWFSRPLAGPVTIAGTVTVNVWGLESSTSANAGAGILVQRTNGAGTVQSAVLNDVTVPATITEYGTSAAAKNGTYTPASTTFAAGDRIKITLKVRNSGTMGGVYTVTNTYDGPAAGAAGDTYVRFTENLPLPFEGWGIPL